MSILGFLIPIILSLQTPEIEQPTIQYPVQEQKIYLYEQLGNYPEYLLLSRIVEAESNWNEKAINPKTKACGFFQIIDYWWLEEAKSLRLENYCEDWKQNIEMGIHIFKTQGLSAWEESRVNWEI